MKFIKYSLLVAAVVSFSSCLKSRTDAGGLLDDKGSIVTSIAEQQYINTDAQNVGAGYVLANANFNFTNRPNEAVKFFTLSVSQPRETKMSGPITFHVTARTMVPGDPADVDGFVDDVLPANAINVTDVTMPASTASLVTMPVKFTVNKTGLNTASTYGVVFRVVSASQGAISALDSSIAVIINANSINFFSSPVQNTSDYQADYDYQNDVVDPVNQYGIHQRTARRYLKEMAPNQLEYDDSYLWPFVGPGNATNQALVVNNFTTGATTALFRPRYVLNAAGNVTSVVNANAAAAVTNLALDPTGINKWTYTSNNERELHVKYTFTLTTTINGVVTPRTIKVSEDFKYNATQALY